MPAFNFDSGPNPLQASMSNYVNYYQRVIDQNKHGLKLVLGGTGLGKTSSIRSVIERNSSRKFIYVANRVQLLTDMKRTCSSFSENVFHVENDTELVLKAIEKQELLNIFEDPLIRKYISYINDNNLLQKIDRGKARRDVFFLRDNLTFIKNSISEEYTRGRVGSLMNIFKAILKEAKKNSQSKPAKGFSQWDFDTIINFNAFKTLFPYIHFKESKSSRLLLITVQKAFFGFFDGERNINISRLDSRGNDNYIIFLDEFDFLENDLIDLISQDYEIRNPFDLVAVFYQRMKKNKLPFKEYLENNEKYKEIKDRIDTICSNIDSLNNEYRIPYPEINHFICNDEKLKGTSIFQTSYSIVNRRVYLHDKTRPNTFELRSEKTQKSALLLFNIVNTASKTIIRLFKDLELDHPDIYSEIARHCFDNTSHELAIQQVKQVGRRTTIQRTNYGEILANGFGLYEIEKDVSPYTDPSEIAFNYYSINTTPEKILLQLCKNNLVFGLSATADINRVLRNFDLEWLKKQTIDGEQFNYFEFDTKDRDDIRQANELKRAKRGNKITYEEAKGLEKGNRLLKYFEVFAENHPDVFSSRNDVKKENRLNRVNHFFATLKWIIQNKKDECLTTHLLFFKSFEQIKYVFDFAPVNEGGLYKVLSKQMNKLFSFYEITIFEKTSNNKSHTFNVVFYNASLGRTLNSEDEFKNEYDKLFWGTNPVVVVTTYPSAGNGVNLQYFVNEEAKKNNDEHALRDFTHIHLLDAPYFYFNGFNDNNTFYENKALIKQNIYSLAKLLGKKELPEPRFKERLNNIRQLDRFNADYLKTEDGKLNQISVFIQAIGRIERVWEPMQDQTIRLCREVYTIFEEFCTDKQLKKIKHKFERHASNNINMLFDEITKRHKIISDETEDVKEDTLFDLNLRSIQAAKSLLDEIKDYRKGTENGIRKKWADLRRFVLKHEYRHPLLGDLSAVFETDYFENGKILINKKYQIVPVELWSNKFSEWDLNGIYLPINENIYIRNAFKANGYELEFPAVGKLYTPYFFQAFLYGALGEEAISVLLKKAGFKFEEIRRELFEIADLKTLGAPYYFDCKNYSENTIMNFSLDEKDPLWHPKLNEKAFKATAIEKFKLIQSVHKNERVRLIYINFIGSQFRPPRFYDDNFEPTDFANSKIIIVQGVVEASNYNNLCRPFESFIENLRDSIHE